MYLSLPAEKEVVIFLDKEVLNRIVLNIVDNASKYSRNYSTFVISIEITIVDIIISFVSEGIRLDEEADNRPEIIFAKGQRHLRDNYKDYKDSQGMGLYIAKNLASSFGGSLLVNYIDKKKYGQYKFILSVPLYYLSKYFNKTV